MGTSTRTSRPSVDFPIREGSLGDLHGKWRQAARRLAKPERSCRWSTLHRVWIGLRAVRHRGGTGRAPIGPIVSTPHWTFSRIGHCGGPTAIAIADLDILSPVVSAITCEVSALSASAGQSITGDRVLPECLRRQDWGQQEQRFRCGGRSGWERWRRRGP